MAAVAVVAVFSTVVFVEHASGRDFTCGCFGVARPRAAAWTLLVRNAFLTSAAIAVVAAPQVHHPGAVLVGIACGFAFLLAEVGGANLGLGRR